MEKEQFISVTHFINPQLFWYHKIDVPNESFHEITQLEQELLIIYKNKSASLHYRPEPGDLVAVHFLSWNKFIRARIDVKPDFRGTTSVFIVWALDYGFPFQTCLQHIRQLPPSFSKYIDHIHCGGLAFVLPGEKEFDFIEGKAKMCKQEYWSQRACECLEKLITDAASVTFTEHFQTNKNHFWGSLKIVNHKGNTFLASDYLVCIDMALEAKLNFRETALTLNSIKIARWLSNNKNYKHRYNVGNCTLVDRRMSNDADNSCDDFSKQKVEDWHARNERFGFRSISAMTMDCATENTEPFIEDIGFEDSVSLRQQPIFQKSKDCYDLDMVELNGVMRLGAALAKSDAEPSPKPPESAFAVNTEGSGTLITCGVTSELSPSSSISLPSLAGHSIASSRTQKLIEIKKKLALKQLAQQSPSVVDAPQTISTSSYQECPPQNVSSMENCSTASDVMSRSQKERLREFRRNMLAKHSEKKEVSSKILPDSITDTTNLGDHDKLSDKPVCGKYINEKEEESKEKKQINNSKDDTLSTISSGACTSYVEFLKNTRKKLQQKKTEQLQNAKQQAISDNNKEIFKQNSPISNQKSSDPYDGCKMFPAGFDLSRLNHYKDENHWHRKKTTLNDVVRHDSKDIEEFFSKTSRNNESSASTHFQNANQSNSDKSPSNNADQSELSNQNFRHTRAHTDKYKDQNLTENEVEKLILDSTVPNINEEVLEPVTFGIDTSQSNECDKSQLNVTDDGLICLNSTTDESSSNSFPTRTRSSLTTCKRGQLKSSAQQLNKIEALLECAQLQKKPGNTEILDLNARNLNSESDSDTNSAFHTANSENEDFFTSQDSNHTPIIEHQSLDLKGKNSQNDRERENKENLIVNELKLKKLAKQLHSELNTERTKYSSTVKKVSTVITLPLAEKMQEKNIRGERDLQTMFIDHMVLAHSKVPVQPVEKLSDAFFLPEIHEEMISMRVTKIYRIQAYSWSHLLRGNSLFVVNPLKSGKTWCYLPPVCNLVSYRIQNSAIPQTYGPVAIIMVLSSTHVENVNYYCRRLLTNSKANITTVPAYGVRGSNEIKMQLLNSCGVLVVTPANLVRLLRANETENLIDPARLQHFIIDDLNLILLRFKQEFEISIRSIFKMVKKPNQQTIPLQVVVTSSDWNSIMKSMMHWSNQPLLLMGDFFEAAVYGKALISIKLRSNATKLASVLRFIEQHPVERERMLIMCNSDHDLHEVERALKKSGYPCIGYASYTECEAVELRTTIEEWKHKNFCSQILVCTDSTLPELKLQNVQNLIHYSMPTSWTKFTMRFATLAKAYENLVQSDFHTNNSNVKAAVSTSSLILLDEENNMQLPRLIEFMKKHNQLKNVHPDILNVAKRVKSEREELHILNGTLLCPFLLEFGECEETHCDYRHNLTPADLITNENDTPTSGDMRIQILKVFSPTYYTGRILEHKSSSGWRIMRRSNEVALFTMKLNMHYMNTDNCIIYWPPKINDICIYRTSNTFQRALILEVPFIEQEHIVKKLNVTVKLIDLGTIITNCKSDELLVCHKEFIAFPAQAVDFRLMGIVPFDNERTWDSKTTKAVRSWIMTDIKINECVHVNINFALKNTIWVKNVIVMERLPTVGHYIYRVNLRRSLIEKHFGVKDNSAESRLLAIKEELIKINLEQAETSSAAELNAELEDSINLIKFSSNDDDDFSNCNETKSSKKSHENNSFPPERSIELKPTIHNSTEENWDNLSDSNIEDFINVPLSNSCSINIEKQSPIHSAKSRINEQGFTETIEKWCTLPLLKLTEVEIGDERENGNWENIFMQCVDKYQMQKFRELNVIIIDHIKSVQKLDEKKHFVDLAWLQPQQNCLVKYDNIYCRAKICAIFGEDVSKQVYRFFLCDYACFVMENVKDLFSDFLYETTSEIIEYTPFQAVHCKLAGVTLRQFAKSHHLVKDYLYAYAVQHLQEGFEEVHGLGIQSYYILLYECENENDFSAATMFNQSLIDHKTAFVDSSSEHFLQLTPLKDLLLDKKDMHGKTIIANKTNNDNDVDTFEEFIEFLSNIGAMDAHEALLDGLDAKSREIQETVGKIKAINQISLEHQNSQNIQVFEPSEIKQIKELDKTVAIDNQTLPEQNDETSLNTSATSFKDVPLLKMLNKRPETEWYQTDFFIYITILAPDVTDYHLEVTPSSLYFEAFINHERRVLILNFLGTIKPEKVSHEIRGLKVIVRLVKTLYMQWPRLLHESTKYPWLKYNYDFMEAPESLRPQQQPMHRAVQWQSSESDTDYNDSEKELFQTFTPIINSEDCNDPTDEVI